MKILAVCVVALILGNAAYIWVNRDAIIPDVEVKHKDHSVTDLKDSVESIAVRIKEQDKNTKTEVKLIYEKTHTKVNALSADAVCEQLNAELVLFCGMAGGSGGLDIK